ncbi:MAG: LuxR C-terminal-related transcriptional regulator [Streptosporangiaceae bacterium]|jgi:DNA-binding NarL/FixJ family response regulator
MPGPLQVIAVSFGPGADFRGRIMAEVNRLQGRGVLRLVDLLFVSKNADGEIERLSVGDDEDFGMLLSGILPLGGAALVEPAADEGAAGFDPSDAQALAESLVPGTALAFLLVEHDWALPLFDAIAESGGSLVGEGFLTAEAGLLVGAEIAAVEEAAQVITAVQDAEAQAMLRAIKAEAESADAIEASEAIRAAAAADAIDALISAGIIEEAAAHEAVAALSSAGVIAAAADEAAADAIAQDTAQVLAADEAAAEAVAEAAAKVTAGSLTMAEARVLRYLATPLTFALIAGKLGISRSAAKERAERAYKKLGVHSRAEAVSRARELGLID